MKTILLLVLAVLHCVDCYAENEISATPCSKNHCISLKSKTSLERRVSLGFDLSQGNGESTSLTIGAGVTKSGENETWDLDTTYSFAEHESNRTHETTKTRNQSITNGSYSRQLGDDLYAAFSVKHLYDKVALVNYRFNLNPGVGYFLVKSDSIELKFEAGPSYVFEKVHQINDDYFAPRAAESFEWVVSCNSKVHQLFEVLYDASDSENYLLNAELGIDAAITKGITLSVLLRHNFDNLPAETREKEDLSLTTSLKATF